VSGHLSRRHLSRYTLLVSTSSNALIVGLPQPVYGSHCTNAIITAQLTNQCATRKFQSSVSPQFSRPSVRSQRNKTIQYHIDLRTCAIQLATTRLNQPDNWKSNKKQLKSNSNTVRLRRPGPSARLLVHESSHSWGKRQCKKHWAMTFYDSFSLTRHV